MAEPIEIAEGVTAHPLPGHTEGSVLYLADQTYCFSGDSLYWSRTTGDIAVAESVTWYSISELAASLGRTAPRARFEWLLPGHGDRKHLPAETSLCPVDAVYGPIAGALRSDVGLAGLAQLSREKADARSIWSAVMLTPV